MKRLLIIVFVLTVEIGYAQTELDSIRTLSEITIHDQRLEEYATGSKIETIDETHIKQQSYANLRDLINRNSAINIRSYGIGGLSTISFRGTGSNQSAILWEGINLQSPSNGSLDLSLIPVSFIDKMALQYGGGSSLFGSGVMGGAVHLSGGTPKLRKPLNVSLFQQYGSYSSQYTGLNLSHSGSNYEFKLRGFTKKADNDFFFFNEFTQKEEQQSNAQVSQEGIMAEGFYRVNDKYQLKGKYWFQDNLTHLPKTKGQGLPSVAIQNDFFHRATLQLQVREDRILINVKTAYVWHKLIYDNAQRSILSNNLTKVWTSEGTVDYDLKPFWKLQTGVSYSNETGEVDGYLDFEPTRHRIAAFSALKGLLFNKLETTLAVRESYNNQEWSPFLPSLGLQYQINHQYALKGKIARSYRVPTFNDLYWGEGGNPNLLPERGISVELGSEQSFNKDNMSFKNEVTLYSNYVHDWILWEPIDTYTWSPNNVQEVWSKGVEIESSVNVKMSNEVSIETSISYQHTDTRVEAIFEEKRNTLNEQMILTPLHSGSLNANVLMKKINLGLHANYTGEQFTDDNTRRGVLDDYLIWDVFVNKQLKLANQHTLFLGLDLRNVFNHLYDVRKGYPMPGRNFNISINYQFN